MDNHLDIIKNSKDILINSIGLERYLHSVGVMEEARKLSLKYNSDIEKATIAGLLHDCGKYADKSELLKKAYDFGIIQKGQVNIIPELIHGALGAEIAMKEHKIDDRDIIDAIKYHTTGKPNMSLLQKIIYIADYIEPSRDFFGVDEIRKLAYDDLNKALLKAMDNTIKHVIDRGYYIHPDTIAARNYLINETN
ncbi:putative HD superfamily hydrolase of NAD metabolism [Proteiniborus ethanoligenes]|uniref:bis(5'-nucleosyl)-tetraphosphatase (symmetrical) n=1 Tax=Proteiniborus ethanoligenes TaxID=415015 RepID=A0A1H3S8Z7_9FIRM|nr:bis(5'-nucleosyl)-tetraphosphatase (symmetrical) YqeK [Proteiniborus ethanoligenes]TAH63771.1 MAG: HD domain-containing protein [Gottschalkiaceae bacterium]SDZ34452.1 putative HD superfamily hydrolase of NAD metabolism [Proteiniborus ethanoligenes]